MQFECTSHAEPLTIFLSKTYHTTAIFTCHRSPVRASPVRAGPGYNSGRVNLKLIKAARVVQRMWRARQAVKGLKAFSKSLVALKKLVKVLEYKRFHLR